MNAQTAGHPQAASANVRAIPLTDSATPARPAAAGGAAPPSAVLPPLPDTPPDGDGWDALNLLYTCFFSATAALATAVQQLADLPETLQAVLAPQVAAAYEAAAEGGAHVYRSINVRMEAHRAGVPLVAGVVEPIAPNPDPDPPADRRCWHCERRLGPWRELPERTANGRTFKVCRHCRASQFRVLARNPLVKEGR